MDFHPIFSDPCTFVEGTNMIVLYVDDFIIFPRTKSEVDEIFNEISNRDY